MKNQCAILINITLFSFIINGSYIIPIQKKLFPHRNKISFSVVKRGIEKFLDIGGFEAWISPNGRGIENKANNSGLVF